MLVSYNSYKGTFKTFLWAGSIFVWVDSKKYNKTTTKAQQKCVANTCKKVTKMLQNSYKKGIKVESGWNDKRGTKGNKKNGNIEVKNSVIWTYEFKV